MPFTISHAAAVLPLRARWLSSSALVIGAMVPDLPLFAPFLPYTTDATHTLFATLVTNVAVGFVLFVVWHGFFARPADWFAPSALRARLAPHQQPGLRSRLAHPVSVIVSLFLGGLTHQTLDWFTHDGTVLTQRLAVFHTDVLGMPLYYFLQIALSVVGLVLIAAWAVGWYREAPVRPVTRQPSRLGKVAARATIVVVPVVALVLAAGSAQIFVMSVAPVVAVLGAATVIALVWHLAPDGR